MTNTRSIGRGALRAGLPALLLVAAAAAPAQQDTSAEAEDTSKLETVIVTGIGDLFPFPKSAMVNFELRHVNKQVPEYALPGAVGFV